MSEDKELSEKVKTYMSRHEHMGEAQSWLSQDRGIGDFESTYLLNKREEIKAGLIKTESKKEDCNTLYDELIEEWNGKLREAGMDFLPPSIPMGFGTLQQLHSDLDTIMEEKMKQAGMGGFKNEGQYTIDIAVSGDKITHESED